MTVVCVCCNYLDVYEDLRHRPEEVHVREPQIAFLHALEDRSLIMRKSGSARCDVSLAFDASGQSLT
jgi:hypothetical protein